MKKVLLLAFSLMATLNANAQWSTKYHEADELRDEPAYWSNLYIASDGAAFVSWSNDDEVKIITDKGIFDYSDSRVKVIVGFYKDNALMEKTTAFFYVPSGDSNTAYTSSYRNPGLGQKIIDWLKNTGDVRFIASKYSGSDFDMKVPHYSGLK